MSFGLRGKLHTSETNGGNLGNFSHFSSLNLEIQLKFVSFISCSLEDLIRKCREYIFFAFFFQTWGVPINKLALLSVVLASGFIRVLCLCLFGNRYRSCHVFSSLTSFRPFKTFLINVLINSFSSFKHFCRNKPDLLNQIQEQKTSCWTTLLHEWEQVVKVKKV